MALSLGYRFRSNNVSGYDFGDLSVDDGFRVSRKLLKRTMENLFLMRLAVPDQLQHHEGLTIGWDQLLHLPLVTDPIVEGETPDFSQVSRRSVRTSVQQYGDWIPVTDVMDLALNSEFISHMMDLQSDQIKRTLETLVFYTVRAGTSVNYASDQASPTRSDVNRTICNEVGVTDSGFAAGSGNLVDLAIRQLEASDAEKIKKMVAASADTNTTPVAASYIAVCSPKLVQDIYKLPDFTPVEQYGSQADVIPDEIGKYRQVRFVASNILTPWADAGENTAATHTLESTSGTNCDVFPILIFASEAFGCVKMSGYTSVVPKYAKPKVQAGSDPLGQRGSCGWLTYFGCAILNDSFMYRLECAASSLA